MPDDFKFVKIRNSSKTKTNEAKVPGTAKNIFCSFDNGLDCESACKKVSGWINIRNNKKMQIQEKLNNLCLSNITFENLRLSLFLIILILHINMPNVLPFQTIGITIK